MSCDTEIKFPTLVEFYYTEWGEHETRVLVIKSQAHLDKILAGCKEYKSFKSWKTLDWRSMKLSQLDITLAELKALLDYA